MFPVTLRTGPSVLSRRPCQAGRKALQDAGFCAPQVTEISYPASAESQHARLSIPVFTRAWLPGLPYEDRMRVLGEARERLGPGLAEQAPWVFFVAWAGGTG
jgi:hypothetical protein